MSVPLNRADYLVLHGLSMVDEDLIDVLNRNGCANWTVCPECRVDDFSHVEDCSVLRKQKEEQMNRAEEMTAYLADVVGVVEAESYEQHTIINYCSSTRPARWWTTG